MTDTYIRSLEIFITGEGEMQHLIHNTSVFYDSYTKNDEFAVQLAVSIPIRLIYEKYNE